LALAEAGSQYKVVASGRLSTYCNVRTPGFEKRVLRAVNTALEGVSRRL
jgi:hypothetical protein